MRTQQGVRDEMVSHGTYNPYIKTDRNREKEREIGDKITLKKKK